MCPACRARYGETPPARIAREFAQPSATQSAALEPNRQSEQREDRLKQALSKLPRGEYATARIAKAAGLNPEKALVRLQKLQAAGEIRQVGDRWSTEPAVTDLEGAFDRLQARTSNLRIVRDTTPAG
jgi:Fic family protein